MRIGRVTGGPRFDARMMDRVESVLVGVAAELADDLAEATLPPTRQAGQAAVAGDIGALFASPGKVAGILRQEDAGKLGAWMDAIEGGAGEARLRQILRGTRLEGVPIDSRPDERRHEAFLRTGHRPPARPAAIVSSRAAHAAFVASRQARVGSARKGWRDAGADLGGSGGGWLSGSGRMGAGRVRRALGRVRVEITNRVSYAVYLLGSGRRGEIIARARRRALERLRRIV